MALCSCWLLFEVCTGWLEKLSLAKDLILQRHIFEAEKCRPGRRYGKLQADLTAGFCKVSGMKSNGAGGSSTRGRRANRQTKCRRSVCLVYTGRLYYVIEVVWNEAIIRMPINQPVKWNVTRICTKNLRFPWLGIRSKAWSHQAETEEVLQRPVVWSPARRYRELNLFIPPFTGGIVFHGRCVSQSWTAGKDYDDVFFFLRVLFFNKHAMATLPMLQDVFLLYMINIYIYIHIIYEYTRKASR